MPSEEQAVLPAGPTASPPTVRVLDVIELLAEQDGEPIRFSDLARRLDLTQGTTHAILATLCDRGWAQRDRQSRTYTIGPGLLRAAGKLSRSRLLIDRARDAASRLAAELGDAVSVVERDGEELHIVGFAGTLDRDTGVAMDDRYPFIAPFGPAFAAWLDPGERRTWFDHAVGDDADLGERVESLLASTRKRGYSLERTPAPHLRALQVMMTLHREPMSPGVQQATSNLLGEITAAALLPVADPAEPEPVVALATPIFNSAGEVVLNLVIHPFRQLDRHQIDAAGRSLVRAAQAVSQKEAA